MQNRFPKELTGWHEDKPCTLKVGVVLSMSRWYEAIQHFIQGHIFIYTWKEPIKLMSWKQPHVIVHHKSLCILARILKTFLLCSFQCQHNGYCLPSHSSDMGCTFRTDKGTMLKSYTYNLKLSTPLRTFALYNSRELLFSPSPKIFPSMCLLKD